MTEEIFLIADLILKRMRGDLGEQEEIILDEWLSKPGNRELWEKLSNEKELGHRMARLYEIDSDAARKKAYEQLFPGVIPMGERKRVGWRRWMAAASVLVVVTVGVMLATGVFREKETQKSEATAANNDILPGTDKAVLRLADGTSINLDGSDNSSLTESNGTLIRNSNGELVYDATKATGEEPVYNLVSTARGGKFSVTLSDGSRIWLNAASSLHFPTTFPGRERAVEITGEAYFDISRNAEKPFIVKVGEMKVEVLGTEFNVMAYEDENSVKTTLLRGEVQLRITGEKDVVRLEPGQQAIMNDQGQITTQPDVDTDEAIAWKNGFVISSDREDLKVIMRQISRWYDVDVRYESTVEPKDLRVKVPRDVKLSSLLKALEISSGLKFEIKGKNIIVHQ